MKKFLFRTLGFAVFFLAVLSLVIAFLVWHGINSHIYLEEYAHKESMLKDIPAPRVIFIGGSNVAFGIDSKMVEDSVGIRAVNQGLQAGVGLRLMMEDALKYCMEGDILVILAEYEHFYGCYHGEKSTLSMLTLLHPHIIRQFDAGNYAVACTGIKDVLSVLAMSCLPVDNANYGRRYIYSSLSFNDYGDESQHWTFPSEGIELDGNHIGSEFDESAFEEFMDDISLLEGRGVEVVMVPPSVYVSLYGRYRREIEYLGKRLAEEGHPYVINIESSVFDRDEMFDSDYHLSRKGIDRRMVYIIDALRKVKGKDLSQTVDGQ